MNTLRQAVHEYLSMRRSLGFKLQDAGKGLLDTGNTSRTGHAANRKY